jgi:hypothetical protein
MTIFFLSILAPAVVFFVYAMVNFQNLSRREKAAGARTILLPRVQAVEQGSSDPAVLPLDPHFREPAQSEVAVTNGPRQQFYQMESAYSGPLLVVPLQDSDVAPQATAAHARLVSAMPGRRI